jgi:hypothetical protein
MDLIKFLEKNQKLYI